MESELRPDFASIWGESIRHLHPNGIGPYYLLFPPCSKSKIVTFYTSECIKEALDNPSYDETTDASLSVV